MRSARARPGGNSVRVWIMSALAILVAACLVLPLFMLTVPPIAALPPEAPRASASLRHESASSLPATPRSPQAPPPEIAPTPATPIDAASSPFAKDEPQPTTQPTTPINPHARLLSAIGDAPPPALRTGGRSRPERSRRVAEFGGNINTENAVEYGLQWLAAHQEADGSWDRFGFGRHCPSTDACPGAATRRKEASFTAGLTGLCALAFLGAGYADPQGRFGESVGLAMDALARLQMNHGGFSHEESMAGYNDALATFAVAEYYSLTRDARFVGVLERAIQRLTQTQQLAGGWDYVPQPASGRNDTSITAWAVQAMLACSASGMPVPPTTLIKAALHFERATEPDGRVWYADSGTGFSVEEESLEPSYRYGPAMTAAGMTCQPLLGWRTDTARAQMQLGLLLQQPPSATLLRGRDPTQLHSYYYWYYGTVAAFQLGGEPWQRWNGAMRDAILPLQNRDEAGGRRLHAFGSWTPFGSNWGKWGRMGGRVYTTAICVLTLEIYYRHTPAYLVDELPLRASDWISFLRDSNDRERLLAIAALRNMRYEIAEPVLVALLESMPAAVSRAAAEALLSLDSPVGRDYLERAHAAAAPWARQSLSRLLKSARELDALPATRGTLRVFDAASRLATIELPRAYHGMPLRIERDGRPIAQMRIVERFAGRTVVVAELLGEPHAEPAAGDAAISVPRQRP